MLMSADELNTKEDKQLLTADVTLSPARSS